MNDKQRALVVPGAYGSRVNKDFTLQQYSDFMVQNAWAYFQWAVTDPRLIGMNPWYWGPPGCGMPGYEVSAYDMPAVRDMWRRIGSAIVGR